MSSTSRYPRGLGDINSVVKSLRHASAANQADGVCLSDELLKSILYYADYDCLHFTAASEDMVARRSNDGQGTSALPYVETEPLRGLGSQATAANQSVNDGLTSNSNGRIRSVRLHAKGKDQGWASNPSAGCWSWFAVAKRKDLDHEVQRGPGWAWNAVACKEWQDHKLVYNSSEPDMVVGEGMIAWLGSLEDGDRVSIIPMARFGGWVCNVQEAAIDIELEVWR